MSVDEKLMWKKKPALFDLYSISTFKKGLQGNISKHGNHSRGPGTPCNQEWRQNEVLRFDHD